MEFQIADRRKSDCKREKGIDAICCPPAMLAFWFSKPKSGDGDDIKGIWSFQGPDGSYFELYDWKLPYSADELWDVNASCDFQIKGDGDVAAFIDWVATKCSSVIMGMVKDAISEAEELLAKDKSEEALAKTYSALSHFPEDKRLWFLPDVIEAKMVHARALEATASYRLAYETNQELVRLCDESKEEESKKKAEEALRILDEMSVPERIYDMADVDVLEHYNGLGRRFGGNKAWPRLLAVDDSLARVDLSKSLQRTAKAIKVTFDQWQYYQISYEDKLHECESVVRLNALYKESEKIRKAALSAYQEEQLSYNAWFAKLPSAIVFENVDAMRAHSDRVLSVQFCKRGARIREDLELLNSLPNLQVAVLRENGFGKFEDFQLPEMKSLRALEISENELSELPAGLFNLKKLEWLDLSINSLKGLPENFFDELPELEFVDLRWNAITYETFKELKGKYPQKRFLFSPCKVVFAQYEALAADAYTEKLALLDKMIEMTPRDGWICAEFGTVLDGLKRHEEALPYHIMVQELNPAEDLGYYNAACCCTQLGRLDEAFKHFEKSLIYCPENVDYAKEDDTLKLLLDYPPFQKLLSK